MFAHPSSSQPNSSSPRLENPLEWLFAEAEWFAKCSLKKDPNFQFYPNPCVQKPGCPAIEKFLKAGGAGKETMGYFAYHGTKSDYAISAICCEGWDPSLRNVQKHGPGEYFSSNPWTARAYAKPKDMLLLAFILEGKWLDKTKHLVVSNPLDGHCAFVVPVGVVCWNKKEPLWKCCRTEPASYVWEWEGKKEWNQFPYSTWAGIEAAFVGGFKECTMVLVSRTGRRQLYNINFVNWRQKNTTTGFERPVRRVPSNSTLFYVVDNQCVPYPFSMQVVVQELWDNYCRGSGPAVCFVPFPSGSEMYRFDFEKRTQQNCSTNGERPIYNT
eukprot:gene4853-7487_t